MLLQSILFLVALIYPSQVIAACYNPGGSLITDPAYQPCNNFQGAVSMCCGTNHTGAISPDECQSNGICRNSGDGVFWRQGCTDKTWKSPFCLANLCTSIIDGGNSKGNVPVGQCPDGTWCCGGFNSTCCNQKLGVSIAATLGATPTTSITPTSTPTTSPTSSPTISNSPTPSPAEGLSSGSKIGIGVGVAGGVLAILAIIAAFYFVKRRSRNTSAPAYTNAPAYEAPGDDSVKYRHQYQEPQEMAAKSPAVEVPATTYRAELPS